MESRRPGSSGALALARPAIDVMRAQPTASPDGADLPTSLPGLRDVDALGAVMPFDELSRH